MLRNVFLQKISGLAMCEAGYPKNWGFRTAKHTKVFYNFFREQVKKKIISVGLVV